MSASLKDFPFAQIPEALIYSDTSAVALKVYCALVRHGMDADRCFPSHARLAKLCHVSTRTVRRALEELESAGWISVVHRAGEHGGQTSNGYDVYGKQRMAKPLDTDGQAPLDTDGQAPLDTDGQAPWTPVANEREQLNESKSNENPPTPKARQERAPRKRTKVEDEAKQRGWTDQQLDAARTYVEQHPNVSYPKRYLAQILQSDPNSQPFITDLRRPVVPLFEPSDSKPDFSAALDAVRAVKASLSA